MVNLFNWRNAFFGLKAVQKQSLKIHPSYQQWVRAHWMVDEMARDLTRAAVMSRSVGQVLQSCLVEKWDQFFLAVQDVPLGCRITSVGVIRDCILGFGRCYLRSASLQQSWSHSPREGLVCSLFLHRVQMPQGWMVAHPHRLSPTSGISSCNIWPVLMWWPARFPSYLAYFSLLHYSVADRDWPLSLWNLPLWPSAGRSFQGLQSHTLSVTSLHLEIKISLISTFLLVSFISWSLLCAGLYFLVSTLMIPRKSIIIYHCVALKVSCENRYTTVFTET